MLKFLCVTAFLFSVALGSVVKDGVDTEEGSRGLLNDFDLQVNKLLDAGATVIKDAHRHQGNHESTVVKTQFSSTQYFGSSPVHDFFDQLHRLTRDARVLTKLKQSVKAAEDRVAGFVADVVNLGHQVSQTVKEVAHQHGVSI